MISLISVMFTAVISQNIVLSQYQGICPFLGVSKKMSSAAGMGFAVIFVMAVASVFCWLVYNFVLQRAGRLPSPHHHQLRHPRHR